MSPRGNASLSEIEKKNPAHRGEKVPPTRRRKKNRSGALETRKRGRREDRRVSAY